MNRHFTLSKALMAILLFLGIALGQNAFAQTTWTIEPTASGNTITYKVKRSGDISQAVTVRYRTVGLSSYEGENFTSANGTLTFPAGIDEKTVTVTSQTPSTEAYKYYQSGATRKYLFEVTDMGGFSLVSKEDNAGAGTVFNTSYLNQSVTDLVYFDYNGSIHSGDGNKYVDASYSSSNWVQVTDGGYSQAVHTISTNNLYSNNSSDASFRSYLNAIGYNMYATVYFTQKEEQDGYQYIQILADNNSTYDGDDPDGAVNAPSTSIYKASFILSYDPSGSVMEDPHYQFFPHRYDYIDRAAEQTAGISHYEFDYDNSHLYQQRFKATSYQSNTSGSLVLAPTVNNLNVRFDAAGSGGDTWDFKNLKVRLALVDATKPKIRNNNDIRVADGAYGYGNTVYITIPFTEIVTVTGSPTLSTTWGELNYVAGSGTNVLTFSGNIQADLGTVLTVNSIGGTSFTIKDLMGNTCNNTSINKTFNGLQVTNPWTGSGTANDPYIIMDRYQLDLLSRLVWSGQWFTNTYFKLGADISYTHSSSDTWDKTSSFTSNFTSIGGWGNSFRGVFDGDGHSISGIRIYKNGTANVDECQGIFGMTYSGSMVKNLVLYDINIVGKNQVGVLVGSAGGTIQDCYIYNARAQAANGSSCGIINGSGTSTIARAYYKNCNIGSNTGQHNIAQLTLTDNATVTRTPVTTVNANVTTYADGATINGEEYYTPNINITLDYSGSVPQGSFVKYTASTSSGDITYSNINNGNVLTMPDADVTVSATILPVVTYLDANGIAQQCSDYTVITSSTDDVEMGASGKTHWYVVNSDATVNLLDLYDATANIILCDGATLTVNNTNGSAVIAKALNIYGQTYGNGTLNATSSISSAISSHALGIYGGIVSTSGSNYGINAGSNPITLGYTAPANRFTASNYNCSSVIVKSGQTLTDGEGLLYSGTYTGDGLDATLAALAGKTLQPAYSLVVPTNFSVTGITAPQGFAPAGEVVTLHTDAGYTITEASYTPAGGSATAINPVEGVWSFSMPTANTTVTATRETNTYTVHFDANATNGINATGTMEDMTFNYGTAQNLTANAFSREGYTFNGWNTQADGTGTAYSNQQNVNNLTTEPNGEVTLYAQWNVINWTGGGTSENDPYLIIYASQLVKLADDVNSGEYYWRKYFKLGNDIDMNGVAFEGIGSIFNQFSGYFNGDNRTISNLTINSQEGNIGLFVYMTGSVSNLILSGANITGRYEIGGIAGRTSGSSSISNCLVLNSNITKTGIGSIDAGVIVGNNNTNAVLTNNHYRNCSVTQGENTYTTNIGTPNGDVAGARSVHTLTLPQHVTATGETVTYNQVTYYASNVNVTLTPDQGFTLEEVTVNGTPATYNNNGTWSFSMPAADATVTCTSSVPYIDANGTQQTCSSYTVIESSNSSVELGTNGQDGWYVVSGNVTITGQLWLKGTNNHLILCDGASLTISHAMQHAVGIYVANNLYIYGQSAGSGTATITITSPATYGINALSGSITINGGIISATSDRYGINTNSGSITINRGSVTAHGYYDGILSGQSIIINGGTVNATTGEGSGYSGIRASQDITLGFTNLTDRITASSYKADYGTISVKANQALYDGTVAVFSGTLNSTQIDAIAGKTLEPCFILTLPELVNATGVIRQDGTTAYALAGNEITIAAVAGYEITSGSASFTMPTHNVVSDVTVQAITYSISYDLAGGSVATANPTTYNIETATFTLNNPTREGYTFTGWTGTDLDEPTMTVTIAQGSTGDRSYTATWSTDAYTITYDLAGGSVATANPTTYNIETATFTLNNPTRQGYTFVGWTGTDLTEPTQTVTIAQGSIGDRTYTATWDRLERYYTFDSTTGELALIWGEFNKDNKWGNDVTPSAVTSVTATNEVSFTGDCTNLFFGFRNCTSMDLNNVNTDGVTNMACMFDGCSSLDTLDLSGWNTGAVTRMDNLFFDCTKLKTLNLTGWDVSHVTKMTVLFFNCQSLTTIEGIKQWNPSHVIGMHSMFEYCKSLKSLDLSGWNTESLTDMGVMFMGCDSIQTLNLSGWDVSNVTDMNSLFWGCKSLETLDVSGWNTSSVTNMGQMFYDCSSLTTLHRSEWNTKNVTNMGSMFYRCSSLTTLDLSDWNTESVTDMWSMFTYCSNLATIYAGEGWSVESAASAGGGMFYDCTSLVGGNGTTYDPNHTNGDYARIDRPGRPGYLTAIQLNPVEYIDADGQTAYCQYYTILNGSTDYIDYGEDDVEAWYVVDHHVTYSDGLYFDGPTNLILVDGATLTINDETEDNGYMSCNDRLTIYVQSEGTGAITAVNSDIEAYGDLIIHGGHIALSSDNDQAYMYSSGDMTINGGAISIENGNYHCIYASGQLTINEGTLNAVVTEGYDGYDVIYSEEDVVINGGNITVTNQGYGRGIWGDNVTINGGSVKVYIAYEDDYTGIATNWGEGVITLGWTDPSDLIMSEGGYNADQLNIATGQAFTDGEGNYYFGTYSWDEMPALAGKTLRPFTNLDETFHITYVTNGGTLPDGYPTTYTFGETVVLPVPTKEDNTFVGWFENSFFYSDPVTEITAGTSLGDLTLYALWKPEKTWVDYLDADGQQQRVYATALYGIETELPGGVYTIVEDDVYFDKLSFTGNTTIILPDDKSLNVEAWGKGTNDDEYSLFVNGDLTIYGQEYGDGLFNSYNVQVSGDVAIYGGALDIGSLSANNGSGTITLSWTVWESYIRVGFYLGDVVLAKAFIDDYYTIHEAGTVADVTTINGQYLYPFITETEVSYLDENGVLQTVTATVLYGGEEATYPGGVYTVLEDMVIRGQAYYDRLHFTGDATIIIPDRCSLGVAATKEDNEYWMHVDGNLTIYGQEYGNGECLFSNVIVNGHVNVYGGKVVLYNISANVINLSWTSIQNEFMVYPTQGTVNLLKDFIYYVDDYNHHVINAQQGVDIATIAGLYLMPYAETIDVSYIDENGDTHTENATMLFGDETNLDGGTYTIMNGISFSHALSFSGDTKLIVPDGTYFYGYYQSGGINLNVTGDLAIYGQENRSGTVLYINASVSGAVTVSNVRVIYSFINSESDILIAGGEHEYGQLSANGTITLGYLTINDEIYCEDYEGTVAIRAGQTMIDYGTQKTYTGTLTADEVTAIKERYLEPYYTSITLDVAGYGESTESDHWVFIASPIVGSIPTDAVNHLIGGMTSSGQYDFDLYRFNQSAPMEWENYHQHNNSYPDLFMLENGKGYLYANKNDVTLEFWGPAYPGNSKEVALDYDANSPHADTRGWNLVGNPFNAPATLDRSYYKMNSSGTGLLAEAVSANTTIEAFTGVMVQAEGEDETVLFTKSDSRGQQETGFGTLQIALTQAGTRGNALLDNAIVSFNEGDQLGKFYFGTQDANLYIPQNNKEYAIAYAGNQTEMPLNFKAHKNGEYTLTVSAQRPIVNYLHLIDNLTGADIDLLAPPCPPQKVGSYTFTARTSDYASRFKLVFSANGTEGNDDFAFIDANGNIIINGTGTLQIIDMLGHVLATRDIHSDFRLLSSDFLSSGVYVLRLINGNYVKTQKIVVK